MCTSHRPKHYHRLNCAPRPRSWQQHIDTTAPGSEEWGVLLQAFFPERNISAIKVPEGFNWKQLVSMHRTLMEAEVYWKVRISEVTLNQVLADMRLAGKMVVCDLNVSFRCTLSLRLGAKFFDFVFQACQASSQQCDVTYNWWCQTVQQLSQTIQVTLADAPPARKEAACASFDSFVKLICKALSYLNRYHVRSKGVATVEQVASPEQAALRLAFGI